MGALRNVAIALLLALPAKCKMSSYVPWSPIAPSAQVLSGSNELPRACQRYPGLIDRGAV